MGDGVFSAEDADGDGGDVVDPTKLFHEYPHPSDWRDRVKEVLENLPKDEHGGPTEHVPDGGRRGDVQTIFSGQKMPQRGSGGVDATKSDRV